MEDKIISVLNNVRTNLSNELETKRKELVKPFDDFADRLSAVEVTPLKIRGLSIEEIDNNFVNISVEILEKLEMYKELSKFSFYPLTDEQKLDISNIMKELIKNDILVVTTGCGASAAAKFGLMTKEARKLAGKGLATVCELVDIPPVLHLGSCVDCSRILEIVSETAKTLDMDICDLPVAGVAPEWMSEKAVAIGTYVVASGIDTYLGIMPPVKGSSRAVEILCDELQDIVGAKFTVNENPEELAQIIISDIEKKRVHFEKLVEEKMKQVVEVEA